MRTFSFILGLFCLGLSSILAQKKATEPEVVVATFLAKMQQLEFIEAKPYASKASIPLLEQTAQTFELVSQAMTQEQRKEFEAELAILRQSKIQVLNCLIEGESCTCRVEICRTSAQCEESLVPLILEGKAWKVDMQMLQNEEDDFHEGLD